MASGRLWKSTGKRVPLIFSATIAASGSSSIAVNPQMNFRAENLVIDSTTGAACTVQMPQVGTQPQIAGGTAAANFPGVLFDPRQAGALDFACDIVEQGNSITLTANNTTTASLNFVAALFGHEVQEASAQEYQHMATTGVAPAGTFRS